MRLAEVQSKLKLARVQERDRSPSPIPDIHKALFKVTTAGLTGSYIKLNSRLASLLNLGNLIGEVLSAVWRKN